MLSREHPPSVTHYAILLAVLILALLTLFGLIAHGELQKLEQKLEASRASAAQQEIGDALSRVSQGVRDNLQRLAGWDEVYQQLTSPDYYTYWHSHRLFHAEVLDDTVIDADLYGPDGRVLGQRAESRMPQTLPLLADTALVDIEGAVPTVLGIAAVRDKRHPQDRIGWVAVRSDFMNGLTSRSGFHFLDASTLALESEGQSTIPLDRIAEAFEYQLQDHPMVEATRDTLADAVLYLVLIVGGLTLVLFPLLLHFLAQPLLTISEHVDRLRQSPGGLILGRLGGVLPVAEIEKIRASINEYQSRLIDARACLDEKDQELSSMAHRDALTGVRNRRAFNHYWQDIQQLLPKGKNGVCFVLFNLDHFKALNDTYGHQVGDAILKTVSACIQGELGAENALFRIGGDEFATLLPDCRTAAAIALAERCQQAVTRYPFNALGIREPVKISIGISHGGLEETRTLHGLQWRADVAMYQAKRPGNARIVVFKERMASKTRGVFSNWVNNAIFEAITHGTGLTMFYQPVVTLEPDGQSKLSYFEALLRIDRDSEWIMPSNIFPVVEARRLELELDQAVIGKVLEDLRHGHIAPGSGVSINLAGPTVSHERLCSLLDDFRPFLKDYNIVLEITETALITQLGAAGRNLEKLRQAGFKVALDDFGSGYSSLRYLATMPVDIVKFDISLVRGLAQESQRNIVLHLAHMILESGYTLVAEGIDSDDLLECVRAAGFRYVQGYRFGVPMEVADLAKLTGTHSPLTRH
jgi:diguanylate cyclase (GGDEF)-like protein